MYSFNFYAVFQQQSSIYWVRLVPQGEKLRRLTSGPLFPGPGSGEVANVLAQFSHHGTLVWEHRDCGPPIGSRLPTNCYTNSVFLLGVAVK